MNFSIAAYSRSCDFLDCAGKASTRKMKSFAEKVSSSSRFDEVAVIYSDGESLCATSHGVEMDNLSTFILNNAIRY